MYQVEIAAPFLTSLRLALLYCGVCSLANLPAYRLVEVDVAGQFRPFWEWQQVR